jgi:hypothetical protein
VYFIVGCTRCGDASSSGEAGAFTVEWRFYTLGKDHNKDMTNFWPEPRPRQGRVLNTYTPLMDANIKTAAKLWLSDEASANTTYGLVGTWDLSQVTSLIQVWCGYDTQECEPSGTISKSSFDGDVSSWNVSKVTSMYQSKSTRVYLRTSLT